MTHQETIDLAVETKQQTGMLQELARTVGIPPNPFGSTKDEIEGTGLCKVVYEMHDARKYWRRTLTLGGSIAGGIALLAGIAHTLGLLR